MIKNNHDNLKKYFQEERQKINISKNFCIVAIPDIDDEIGYIISNKGLINTSSLIDQLDQHYKVLPITLKKLLKELNTKINSL